MGTDFLRCLFQKPILKEEVKYETVPLFNVRLISEISEVIACFLMYNLVISKPLRGVLHWSLLPYVFSGTSRIILTIFCYETLKIMKFKKLTHDLDQTDSKTRLLHELD